MLRQQKGRTTVTSFDVPHFLQSKCRCSLPSALPLLLLSPPLPLPLPAWWAGRRRSIAYACKLGSIVRCASRSAARSASRSAARSAIRRWGAVREAVWKPCGWGKGGGCQLTTA